MSSTNCECRVVYVDNKIACVKHWTKPEYNSQWMESHDAKKIQLNTCGAIIGINVLFILD